MDEYNNNNNVFGGYQDASVNPFGGASMPSQTEDKAHGTDDTDGQENDTTIIENTTTVEPEPVAEDGGHKKRGGRRRSGGRSAKRSDSGNAISTDTVRRILDAREKLEIIDDETRKLAAKMLGVKDETDELKFVVTLMDPGKVSEAKESLKALVDTYDLPDLEFGMMMGAKTHAERKAVYELEELIAPNKAAEVLDGGRFPANNPMEEVSIIRRIQKESPDFKGIVDSVNELLG